jgi:hypothetical protein
MAAGVRQGSRGDAPDGRRRAARSPEPRSLAPPASSIEPNDQRTRDELPAALAANEAADPRGREVTVPAAWRVGTRRKVKRPRWKACYEAAGRYVRHHPDLAPTLVHGTYMVDPWPVPTPHAWVEIESATVYDGVTGRFYDRTS